MRSPAKPWPRSQPACSWPVTRWTSAPAMSRSGCWRRCRLPCNSCNCRRSSGRAPAQAACHRHLGRRDRPVAADRRRRRAISRPEGGHHRADRVGSLVPGDGCHCRLRLEFLDARSRAGKRIRPLLRPPGRRDDRSRDRARAGLRAADRRLEANRPEHTLLAYSAVFIVSAALGLFGVWLLSITPEQPMPPSLSARAFWACWRHRSETGTSGG